MAFFNYGFYEVLYKTAKKHGLSDKSIGENFENFIKNKFKESNIEFLHNEKYDFDQSMRNELNTTRENGECDFIIETPETIIFIEAKKRSLSSWAQNGDIAALSSDLAYCVFSSQIQCNWHEIILKKYNQINFKSGKKLIWKNRTIEKISLSMFDFMSLHDGMVLGKILSGLYGKILVDTSGSNNLSKINEKIIEWSDQYSRYELKDYFKFNHPFMNCRFFNAFQLIELLDGVNSAIEFKNAIWSNRHVTTGEKDWFVDNQYLNKLRDKKSQT